MTKILYIAGYGRSGSTALSAILGNHQDIINSGELSQIITEWGQPSSICSCGKPYGSCPFWGDLYHERSWDDSSLQQYKRIEKISSLPRVLAKKVPVEERHSYRIFQENLFAYIRERSGKRIVLDSSKSAWSAAGRFLALQSIVGEDVFVIHLVRNGLAAMESQVLKGKNSDLETQRTKHKPGSAFRTAFGWGATNAVTNWLGGNLPPARYKVIKYEDLIAEPNRTLEQIGQFCGLDFETLQTRVSEGDQFEVGHVVAGNRLRFGGAISLRHNLRNDYGSRLRFHQRAIFHLMDYPMQRHFGYSNR